MIMLVCNKPTQKSSFVSTVFCALSLPAPTNFIRATINTTHCRLRKTKFLKLLDTQQFIQDIQLKKNKFFFS